MSSYPTDDSVHPTTPLFDETVTSTAVYVDLSDADFDPDASDSKADAAKQAAGQAKDTVTDTAAQAKDTVQETADHAKDQAKQVGAAAADAGQRVASTTKEQAGKVAADAVGQARELYGQATDELSTQAAKQQKNAAATLRTFGDDLSSMHEQAGGGLAAELVHTLSQRATSIAGWLEDREPGEVLDEVKQFAARRPGFFIGLAAVAGVVAARATKALVADAKAPADAKADTADLYGTEPAYDTADPFADGSTGYGDLR